MNKKDTIKNLGIGNVLKTKQDKIIKKIEDNIKRRISLTIFDLLSQKNKKELEKIIKSGKKKEVFNFLKEKISDLDFIFQISATSIIEDFKEL